ncbi:Mitochondrial small ribosomal subunit Rsm22 family protein [Theileria parva strain Muguga]|uniref:Mitochondrial small ribosomal subunit Rsm22 family protein n=1 Tax=Theileria parva strain Muguga TaxID=333668 RepID=UPI001C61B590|nr:Mitochondrial small ribosomal subunit Rsm22 family protein [Theileria parva strain Muguga]KAF5153357.1 Mitochondrial small ribosomal subunit Rsm22 family protein [Theileria parva strain Muguga]
MYYIIRRIHFGCFPGLRFQPCSLFNSSSYRIQNVHTYPGIRYDKIPNYHKEDLSDEDDLNDVSRLSIKTLPFPSSVKEKLFALIKSISKKRDIDNIGSYISKKMASRTCVELPKILPSVLLDSNTPENKYLDQLKNLSKDSKFTHLYNLLNKGSIGPNEQAQINLSEAEDSRHKNSNINYSPQISVAYTAHTFFGHYAVFLRIFHEINKRVENLKLSKIMFYNPGHGASLISANTIWDLKSSDILVVEPSQNLLKICQHLTSDLLNPRFQNDIYEITEHFDLIVLPYVLSNTLGHKSRSLLVKNLWNRLNVGGIMVVAEPGTPTGFRMIHSLRELFISQLQDKSFHFIAPCPHEGICPLALTGKDWCHFSQRIYRIPHYIYNKGSISKSIDNEKFSYLVIGKYTGPRSKYPKESLSISPAERSYFWPRIVMHPLKVGRRVLIDVCSSPNHFKRLIVPKNTPESSGYKYARDALWGDLWRFAQRVEKPVARGYTPPKVVDYLLSESEREQKIKSKIERTEISIKDKIEQDMIRNYSA